MVSMLTIGLRGLSSGVVTGLGAYLLSGKKFFNVYLIAPNVSFAKGALIGSSMLVAVNSVNEIITHFFKTSNKEEKIIDFCRLLSMVATLGIPGFIYGRSYPLTAISMVFFAIVGIKGMMAIEEFFAKQGIKKKSTIKNI